MSTRDDQQDARIAANEEAIRQQTEYLKEIRNNYYPQEEERRAKRLAKLIVGPILKGLAVVAFIGGLWDVIAWYLNRYEVSTMARRYAHVAEEIYYGENNPEVACEFLDKAIDLRDTNAEYRFLRAYMQGMAAVKKILNLDRPLMRDELNEAHKALAEAKYLKGLQPDRAEPYLLESQIYAALKETDRAEKALSRALELDPGNDFAYTRRAHIKYKLKDDPKGALSDLDRALELNPASKWAWQWKGEIYARPDGDLAQARLCYEKAINLSENRKFDNAWWSLGMTYLLDEKMDCAKARENFLTAWRINPASAQTCFAIGLSYGYEDEYELALVWLDKAVALDGRNLPALEWRGVVHHERKAFAQAVADFDRAIQLDPLQPDLFVKRAISEKALGRDADARHDLEIALMLNADHEEALALREQWSSQCESDQNHSNPTSETNPTSEKEE